MPKLSHKFTHTIIKPSPWRVDENVRKVKLAQIYVKFFQAVKLAHTA